MLIEKWKKLTLLLTAAISLHGSSQAAIQTQPSQMHYETADFTQSAKEAIPAVVSIKVEAKKHPLKEKKLSKHNPWSDDDDEESEEVGSELWKRFFGLPGGEKNWSEPFVGQGSGFIVSADGYILTNNHVVQNVDVITVTLNDGTEMLGKVIGQDNNSDVALIKIDGKNLPFLKLGNSDEVSVAQPVMAIGTPAGLQATVTVGVISAKSRNNLDLARIEDFIQTDAAINRGNSGGPLLNIRGEVIGLNTAMASSSGGYMGLGFAVPSNIAKNVMDQLLTQGSIKRSFIGVELQAVDHNLAQAFGLPKIEGALVAQVLKDSPADKAALKQGDVIIKLNDVDVSSVGALRTSIALMTPGTRLKLSVIRDGKPLDIMLSTGEFASAISTSDNNTQESTLGVIVTNLTPEISQRLGLHNGTGVVVTHVESGSSAQMAGLHKGTIIMAVNQQKIKSTDDFTHIINTMDKTKPILLLVKEGNSVRYLSFKMG